MTREETNVLTLKPLYKIRSVKTGRIYIDKNFSCYLFESEREAKQFCDQMEDLEIMEEAYVKQAPFISFCYGLGIETIRVKETTRENFTNIKIDKNDVKQGYYNPVVVRNILRLKQTQKKKYIRELMDKDFLVAVHIKDRKEKEYPLIQYVYASLQDDTKYYLLFTTLSEFDNWNMTQDDKFKPYKINFSEFKQIRKNSPILINPISDKLIITSDQLD